MPASVRSSTPLLTTGSGSVGRGAAPSPTRPSVAGLGACRCTRRNGRRRRSGEAADAEQPAAVDAVRRLAWRERASCGVRASLAHVVHPSPRRDVGFVVDEQVGRDRLRRRGRPAPCRAGPRRSGWRRQRRRRRCPAAWRACRVGGDGGGLERVRRRPARRRRRRRSLRFQRVEQLLRACCWGARGRAGRRATCAYARWASRMMVITVGLLVGPAAEPSSASSYRPRR